MKKFYFIFFTFYLLSHFKGNAQGGVWTWMRGDTVIFNDIALGNYGTMGVSSPTNDPPGRYHSHYWRDKQGDFWMFGGHLVTIGYLNDLWKYTVATNEWTWIKGPSLNTNTAGIMGVQGIPSINNYPPSCNLSGNCWTDTNNNLWLYHSFGDLWRYNIATNIWTWMKGSGTAMQAAVYGTMGVADIANTPGYHAENKTAWTDANNNLWLYHDGNIWKYNISTNEWTWMKGPGAGANIANYGIMGVPSITNQPGFNNNWQYWQDQFGMFYLGFGMNSSAVWKYDMNTNMWTWISGEAVVGSSTGAKYLSQCIASTDRHPGKRIESRGAQYFGYPYCSDFLWFSGGQAPTTKSNDLWLYKPSQNTWTWIAGDSVLGALGNYGVQGVPSTTNIMPCRTGHIMWVDSLQQIYIFGGLVKGASRGNDLWRFTPDPICIGLQSDSLVFDPIMDTFICAGGVKQVAIDTSLTVVLNPLSYTTINADTSLINFTPPITTTYTITVSKWINSCFVSETDTFTIFVQESIMPIFSDSTICEGQSITIPLDTSFQFQFSPNATQYQEGDSIAIFTASTTTEVIVTAVKNGCALNDTSTFTIHVLPKPIASFTLNPTSVEISQANFTLTNQSSYATKYSWFVNGVLFDTSQHVIYNAKDTGNLCFTLLASNQLECVDSFTNCGIVLPGYDIFIPNVFSPNGDFLNDEFNIIAKNIKLKSFSIFNRWGQEVFYTNSLAKGWDGKFKGVNADQGVYFYLIEFSNLSGKGFTKKGDLTLIR